MNEGSRPSSQPGHDSLVGEQPLRIIVADDERDTVLTLMLLLQEEGHEVRGIYSGRHVLSTVREFDPDAVVLDINLRDATGWEIAEGIRQRRGRARPMLIGMSGEYKLSADRVLSQILGFDHYLLKPFEPALLMQLLAPLRLLRRYQAGPVSFRADPQAREG